MIPDIPRPGAPRAPRHLPGDTMQLPQIDPAAGPQFTVGDVLHDTCTAFRKNPFLFFMLSFLAWLPFLAAIPFFSTIKSVVGAILSPFLLVVCFQLSQGAIAHAVHQQFQHGTVSFKAAVSCCCDRLVSLSAAAVLIFLGTKVGLLFLVVPGLVLMCVWAVAIPACAVERLDAVESMVRSADLTVGRRWRVFAILVASNVLFGATLLFPALLARLSTTQFLPVIFFIAFTIAQGLGAVMTAVMYCRLKTAKDGISFRTAATVFD